MLQTKLIKLSQILTKRYFPGCFNAIELYYSKRIFTDLQPLRSHTHGHINSAYFLFLIWIQVWSKNNAELDEFKEDAVKILRGQSADLFPESVIDQLFKDTFESDIFLTSGDYFVVDPLVFFTSEFEQEINSLW